MNILAELEAIVAGLNQRIEALEQHRELNRRLVARVEALEAAEHQRQPIDKDIWPRVNHDPLVLPTIEETYGHDDVRELVLAARKAKAWCCGAEAITRLESALKHFENIK